MNEQIPNKLHRKRHVYTSYKSKADAKRTAAEKFADLMTDSFGSVAFLVLNLTWFVIWIPWNMGLIPGVEAFDPFPFGLLTMIVSLEAIFLAIVVLISQNRAARIADLREEIDLQVNLISEEEITKLIKMLSALLEKQGINTKEDEELQQMLRPIQGSDLEKSIENQLHTK
ncbi:MAG: hypothetical protein K0S20_616 [Patescibacteria group bacterium]|jgi:uncharacterized membrane protein|nr:hypothetical protein [Patescibacteria group bacterium]